MSGGKGGSTSSSITIPEYIEEAARRNLAKAEGISQIGYVPYYGPDVAAFTPFQQAGFQQTADVASAFGLGTPTTQADIMGGMPEPTQFAGGVRGYSAAPLYQQAVDELAAQRPAQAQYIESFFIDPVTGQAGTRVQPAVDYSTMGTMADIRAADRANELAIAQAQAAAGPSTYVQNTTLTPVELSQYASTVGGANYNPQTDVLTPEQAAAVQSATPEGTAARIAQEDIAMNILGSAGMGAPDVLNNLVFNTEPTFEDPSSTGSYGGSLVTGDVSGATYGIPTILGNVLDELMPIEDQMALNEQYMAEQMGSVLQPDGTYDISSWFDASAPPTDPFSGSSGATATPEVDYEAYLTPVSQPTSSDPIADAQSSSGQYTGFMDMFDGGGPNASGGPFEGGGLLSDAANFMAQGGVIGGVVKALEDALGIGPAAAATDVPAAPAVPATSVSLDNPLLMGSTARAGAVQTSNPNVSVVSTPSGNQYFGTPVGTDPATGSTRYVF